MMRQRIHGYTLYLIYILSEAFTASEPEFPTDSVTFAHVHLGIVLAHHRLSPFDLVIMIIV